MRPPAPGLDGLVTEQKNCLWGKAEERKSVGRDTVKGSKQVSGPRQRGLCANHLEEPGPARGPDGSGFLGLPPPPRINVG